VWTTGSQRRREVSRTRRGERAEKTRGMILEKRGIILSFLNHF